MKKIDKELVSQYVVYAPEFESGLAWAKKNNYGNIGEMAGKKYGKGYFQVSIKNETYRTHRVVCVLHGMNVDGLEVDHIDGNKSNNKVENLRLVTSKENNRNRGLMRTNKTGFIGVSKVFVKGIPIWRADWRVNNEKFKKCFSVKKYGEWNAFALAWQSRVNGLALAEMDGVKFTDRHKFTVKEQP